MNYNYSRFRIMFLGLAVLTQSLNAYNSSIDLIEWVSTHNNSSKELSFGVIVKNKKTKKSQKKMGAIKKNIFYGIAGLAILALAIYSYKYTLGLALVQKPDDGKKNAEVGSENLPTNSATCVEPPKENVVPQQVLPVPEQSDQIAAVGFPDQVSVVHNNDIVAIQPIQQIMDNVKQARHEEVEDQKPVHVVRENSPSTVVDRNQLVQDSTINNNKPQVNVPPAEKVIEELIPEVIKQEPTQVSTPNNDHEIPDEKTQELENPGLQQQASDNNHDAVKPLENRVVVAVQDLSNTSEDMEKTLRDEVSAVMKRIAELKWQDETTYEDWQEITKLQKHLDELQKRSKAQ